jgi:FKBP-type peptidyl-prolyl cis-trans isomerase FklB
MKITALVLLCLSALNFTAIAQTPSSNTKPKSTTPSTKKRATSAAPKPAAKSSQVTTLKDQKEKASYALGLNVGTSFKKQQIDIDPNLVAKGLTDAYTGAKPLLTESQIAGALNALKSETMAKQQGVASELAVKNKAEGEKFLAENKSKPGVTSLPSGLQYKVIQEGSGPKPTPSDVVVCHYRGTLLDGSEFDSSFKRGQPASFPVSGVIRGWTEALQLMPVGSKWQLFVPADLAYGERGAGADIGPNATLIFEVELVSIETKK